MKVHTSTFKADLAGKVCIARTMPPNLALPHLTLLAPSSRLLAAYKQGNLCWQEYAQRYWSELADKCRSSTPIWTSAKTLVNTGKAATQRQACVLSVVTAAAHRLGADEITLCCWEASNNPRCHRRLIYHELPKYIRGVCL